MITTPENKNKRSSINSNNPMPKYIRRSILALSIDDPILEKKSFDSWADAIILDFSKKSHCNWQQDILSRMPSAIAIAAKGDAEIFIRIDNDFAISELEATVFPGIAGIILKGAHSAADIQRVSSALDSLELSRGILANSIEIDIEVNNAACTWNLLEIARSSARVGIFLLNEQELCANLGIQTQASLPFDPLEYIKSELITVATSIGGQAVGMSYPLSLATDSIDAETLRKGILRARDTGFKGAVCPHPDWINLCNSGFRPSEEEANYYVKVIEVFAEGIKRGMASVPIDGKMIDVPVDLRAKVYLEWAKRAKARDTEKHQAHQKP
jgi:hypothetical protein